MTAPSNPAERAAATPRLLSMKLDDPFMAFWGALNREIVPRGLRLSFESAARIWSHTCAVAELEAENSTPVASASGGELTELVEALRDALEALDYAAPNFEASGKGGKKTVDIVRAALAKAEGRSL